MKSQGTHRDIYVSDISYDVTEEELRQLFSLCGTVRMLQLQRDAQGHFKGTAYVRMADEKQTREAVNMLDGTLLQNRCIKVALSRTKQERTDAISTAKNDKKTSRRRRNPRNSKGKPGPR